LAASRENAEKGRIFNGEKSEKGEKNEFERLKRVAPLGF
jgi:hypothetical protein